MKTIEKMDMLARQMFGEFGFATCHEVNQVMIVEALIENDFTVTVDAINPQDPIFLMALGRKQVFLNGFTRTPNAFEVRLEGTFDNLVSVLTEEFGDESLAEFITPVKFN